MHLFRGLEPEQHFTPINIVLFQLPYVTNKAKTTIQILTDWIVHQTSHNVLTREAPGINKRNLWNGLALCVFIMLHILWETLTAINNVSVRRERNYCSKRRTGARCCVMLGLCVCVSVCVFLQQVDTDEAVFTMTEHLFPHWASTVSSHIAYESALPSDAFLNHQKPNHCYSAGLRDDKATHTHTHTLQTAFKIQSTFLKNIACEALGPFVSVFSNSCPLIFSVQHLFIKLCLLQSFQHCDKWTQRGN